MIYLSLPLPSPGLLLLSAFHGGDAQPLPGQPKDSLLSRLDHAGHHLWLGSPPSKGWLCTFVSTCEWVSDRRVRAVDTRKRFRDTRCSPGLGFVVRNHGLAALLFSRFDLLPASMVAQLHHLPPALGIVPVRDGIIYKNPRMMLCPAKLHMWSRWVALGACTQVAEWWAGPWHWRWLHSSWRRRGERVAACCEGMTPGTSGGGRLRGRSLWDSTCPADRRKMVALWGAAQMCPGCPWPRCAVPRSATKAGVYGRGMRQCGQRPVVSPAFSHCTPRSMKSLLLWGFWGLLPSFNAPINSVGCRLRRNISGRYFGVF